MFISSRSVSKTRRAGVRLLVLFTIASVVAPMSPAQAEAAGEHSRRLINSGLELVRNVANRPSGVAGSQDFGAQQVEDPARKTSDVARFRLCPRHLRLYVGEAFTLVAVPIDRNKEVVQAVSARWETRDVSVADVSSWGEVSAITPGHTQVTVRAGSAHANVSVDVREGVRPKLNDSDWEPEHRNDCDDPEGDEANDRIGANGGEDELPIVSNAAPAQSRFTRPTPKQLPRPAALHRSLARTEALNAAARRPVTAGALVQGGAFIIDGGGSDTFAQDAVQYNNDLGSTRFTAQDRAQGAHKNKHNLGSFDYFFSAPVLSSGGRGIGVNLALNYNSRPWNKDASVMTFNYNKGWPAAGWTLGYGRIIQNYNGTATGNQSGVGVSNRPGDYLLIQPDGSRTHLGQAFDSVSGIYKHDSIDGTFLHLNDGNWKLKYPDGTVVKYNLTNNRLLPASIETHNGDLITIAYRNKTSSFPFRWAIDSIIDSLGRVTTFNYDLTTSVLTSITAPDQAGSSNNVVQIDYQNITLQYSFVSGLTVDPSAPASGSQLGVVRRIYYPATGRGYVFLNYSGHGMAKKISQRIGMTAVSDGTEVAYTEYTFADTGALIDSPRFTERKEWWQGKTDSNGTPDNLPTTYSYSRSVGAGTEINTVGYPNNLDVVTTTDSNQFSQSYGKVLGVVYKNHTTSAALREISYSYVFPVDGGIQMGTVNTWDDVLNKTKTSYDYGTNARLANVYEYGLKDTSSFKVRRRTSFAYSDDANILGANMYQLVTEVKVYDALFDNDDTNDVLKAKTVFTYDNYAVKGGMEFYGLSSGSYPPNHDSAYDQNKTARGNLTGAQTFSSINPDVSTTRYNKYDIFGNVVNADMSCCQVKTVTFNSATYYSQPVSVTNGTPGIVPFLTTGYVYDFNTGLTMQTTDSNNLTTSFLYDKAWRLKQVNPPGGAVVTTSFDKDANQNDLLSYTQQMSYVENGVSKTVTNKSWFDGAGHALRSGSGAGASPTSYDVVAAVYDNVGRVAKQSNPYSGDGTGIGTGQCLTNPFPNLCWRTTVYDELSRANQEILPDSQTITTTYSGVKTTLTDQVGRQRQSEVDGLGRTVKVTEQNPATGLLDATTYLTSYSYDVLDNLTQVNHGNQLRTFIYDTLSRVISQTTPEAGTVSFTYTDSGDVLKRTDARTVETHYKYDSLNRPIQLWYTGLGGNDAGTTRPALPSGVAATADVTVTYNNFSTAQSGNGQVASVTDGAGSESYSYDSLSQLVSKTRVIDSRSYQSQYVYNTAGQMTTLIYPSGKRVRTNHDARGRTSGLDKVDSSGNVLSSYMTSVGYNTASQPTSVGLANGVNETYVYSPDRLQLTSQTATKGSTLMSLNYSYVASAGASGAGTTSGNTGQLMAISTGSTINGQARSQAFTYDNVGRLATASGWSAWGRRWGYDRWGNRTGMWDAVSGGNQLQNIAIATTGGFANNRIANVNGVTYSYDASGNCTNDGGHIYGYDGEARQANVDNGSTAASGYDFADRRAKKTAGGLTTHYVWEGAQVIAEYNGSTGTLISEYIYAKGRLVARDQSGVLRYYHQDRLSTRLITDSSGNVVGTQDHLPFGEDPLTGAGETEKHRFTSYERDSESNNDHAINRQHQYANGRFNRPDVISGTVGNPQSLNRYSYSQNDPENLVDPDGRLPLPLITGLVGLAVGAIGSAAGQVIANGGFDNFSWKAVAVGAGTGFVTGALAPVLATTYLGAALLGAAGNVVQYAGTQYVTDQKITGVGLGISLGTGALGGLIAGPINRAALQYVNNPLPWIRDRGFYAKWNLYDNAAANVTVSTLSRNLAGGIATNVVPTGGSSNTRSGGSAGRMPPATPGGGGGRFGPGAVQFMAGPSGDPLYWRSLALNMLSGTINAGSLAVVDVSGGSVDAISPITSPVYVVFPKLIL